MSKNSGMIVALLLANRCAPGILRAIAARAVGNADKKKPAEGRPSDRRERKPPQQKTCPRRADLNGGGVDADEGGECVRLRTRGR